MTDTALATIEDLEKLALVLSSEVRALVIRTPDDFAAAGRERVRLATAIKRGHDLHDEICQATDHAHKVAVRKRAGLIGPWEDDYKWLGGQMAVYEQGQARIRREAEEAQRRERERLEREAREQAAAEQRRLQKESEDARLEAAAALERAGDTRGAQKLIEAPIAVPTVTAAPVVVFTPPPPAAPKAEGTSFRTDHGFEIIHADLIPRIYLMVNESAIGKVYKALGPKTDIPGTKYVERRVPITRTA